MVSVLGCSIIIIIIIIECTTFIILSCTHLSPGGSEPVQTWLKVTGQVGLRSGGHGSTMERPQGPFVPHVDTRDLPWFRAPLTVPGALGSRCGVTHMCSLVMKPNPQSLTCVRIQKGHFKRNLKRSQLDFSYNENEQERSPMDFS